MKATFETPAVQKIYDKYMERRAKHPQTSDPRTIDGKPRHTTELSWKSAGIVGGSPGYFVVYYCTACKLGSTTGFTYECPAGQSYDELGVELVDKWDTGCSGTRVEGY